MANANGSRRVRITARHSIVAAVLVLLPLLALGGALMPGMVDIDEAEEDTSATISEPYFAPLHVKRRPLLIPKDFSTGFLPDLVNLNGALGIGSSRDLLRQQIANVEFGMTDGDLIILDDIEEFVRDVLFKDAVDSPQLDDDPSAFDDSLFAIIPKAYGVDTPFQFDDFGGSAAQLQAVPEPATALLMGLGLTALAWFSRR